MPRRAVIFIAALAALAAAARPPAYLLAAPQGAGDPYLHGHARTLATAAAMHSPACGYFGGATTGLTVIAWMKVDTSPLDTQEILHQGLTIDFCHTLDTARRHLPDLRGEGAYATPLVLDSSGNWSAAGLLPAAYAHPADLEQWDYGVFCVNIETDTALTLTVGGSQKSVPAANGRQVFNIVAAAADRSVSVAAAPGATVKLGIAVQPCHQLTGVYTDGSDGYSGNFYDTGGIVPGWRMIAFRSHIAGSDMVDEIITYNSLGRIGSVSATTEMASPIAAFPTGCLWKISTIAPYGYVTGRLSPRSAQIYGIKVVPCALDDAKLALIHTLDERAMIAKGFSNFDGESELDPNYVAITSRQLASQTSQQSAVDSATERTVTETIQTSYSLELGIRAGANNRNGFTLEDYTFACADEGTSISNRILTAPGGGLYHVSARDPIGNVYTQLLSVAAATTRSQERSIATHYRSGLWSAEATASVIGALTNATNDGSVYTRREGDVVKTYHKWRCRRLPGMPIEARSPSGQYAFHAISPHVIATADHFFWKGSQPLSFSDGSVTNLVSPGVFQRLDSWALEHGFSQADVDAAGASDIAIAKTLCGTIPDACCPSFIAPADFTARFGTTNDWGVIGWMSTQTDLGWGLPILVHPGSFGVTREAPRLAPWRDSIIRSLSDAAYNAPNNAIPEKAYNAIAAGAYDFAPVYSGNSGHPVYLEHDGTMIAIGSLHFKDSSGSSYVRAFNLIKAFVEAAGDELKVVK